MDINKITDIARKKINVGKFTGNPEDFCTIKIFPLKARSIIFEAQKQGCDIKVLQDFMAERGIFNMNDPETKKEFMENKELSGKFQLEDYDPFRTSYKIACLKYGICKEQHSFVRDGVAVEINDEFINYLTENFPSMCEYLIDEIEKYQQEMRLGEGKKKKSITP